MTKTIGREARAAIVSLLLALALLAGGAATPQALAAPAAPLPPLDLGAPARGEQAVRALGANLPDVARAYGLTGDELRRRLRTDRSLAVDPRGRLVFTCEGLVAASEPRAATVASDEPLAATFTLHSRPGSSRVIYLDFDGHRLTGTAWNVGRADPLDCPAWDTDGDPAVFGDAERRTIQHVWQRVAEDYAPFDVDVTTEAPPESALVRTSEADTTYGVRCLISPISSTFGDYGGIAYVGIFDDSTGGMPIAYAQPALVFPENLANAEKPIAEAASHEVGHTLGLYHDGVLAGDAYYAGHGSGETGWAPIMGVGYFQNLTQWSRGEYLNANNHEDDLAVIGLHGLARYGDDHGDETATATGLTPGADLAVAGVVEGAADVDVFRFRAGAGHATFAAVVAPYGPDLDLELELLDENGAPLAANNPAGALGAGLAYELPLASTYYLRVRGVGKGDAVSGYTDYASLGRYSLAGAVVAPSLTAEGSTLTLSAPSTSPYASVTLSGRLVGETGQDVAGRAVAIEASGDGLSWAPLTSVTTAAGGAFAAPAAPTTTTTYRARFAGDAEYDAAQSVTRTVKPRVRLTRPGAPKTVARRRAFTTSSHLWPRHAAGSRPVKIHCYRREGGRWVLRKSVRAKAANYGDHTRVRGTIALPYAGWWRLRAVHYGDSKNATTWSARRYLRVR